jgi:hypothetical protein
MADQVTIKAATTGYKHDAICELTNGQVWQQTSHEYSYQYQYRPDAKLAASGSRGALKLSGHEDGIDVKKIR